MERWELVYWAVHARSLPLEELMQASAVLNIVQMVDELGSDEVAILRLMAAGPIVDLLSNLDVKPAVRKHILKLAKALGVTEEWPLLVNAEACAS